MPRGDNLTYAVRQRAGWANWDLHHRIPPGRKRLPRLSANEEEARRPRGGYDVVRRVKGGAAPSADTTG